MTMYGLYLNPMCGRAEGTELVAVSESAERLAAFVQAEMVEPYRDENWHKAFKQGGPLEWFNPPSTLEPNSRDAFGHGIRSLMSREEAIAKAAREYDGYFAGVRRV